MFPLKLSKASKHRPCTVDCEHNPFSHANYQQVLELEEVLDHKTMERSKTESTSRPEDQPRTPLRNELELHCYFSNRFFVKRHAAGRTFAEGWEQAGLAGLKNDERVLWRGKSRMRVALLEFHRVLDEERVEAVDLLSPEPQTLVFHERSMARRAVRFYTVLALIYPLPHYWRISGASVEVRPDDYFSAAEIIREITAHLGGPAGEPELRRWLAENFVRVSASLAAVSEARYQAMMAGFDAKWCKAHYEICAPFAQCRDWLDQVPELQWEELSPAEQAEGMAEARVWLEPHPKGAMAAIPGRELLGRVLMGQMIWRLETTGEEKLSQLRSRFESHLGARVRFVSEWQDDCGARQTAQKTAPPSELVPPRLLTHTRQLVLITSLVPTEELPGDPLEGILRRFLPHPLEMMSICQIVRSPIYCRVWRLTARTLRKICPKSTESRRRNIW